MSFEQVHELPDFAKFSPSQKELCIRFDGKYVVIRAYYYSDPDEIELEIAEYSPNLVDQLAYGLITPEEFDELDAKRQKYHRDALERAEIARLKHFAEKYPEEAREILGESGCSVVAPSRCPEKSSQA